MSNRLRMCLLFILLATALCFLHSACATTEQPSAYKTEPNGDPQVLSQPEPDSQVQHVGLEAWEQSISIHGSLPDYKLRLYGDDDVFTDLSIVDPSTGAVVYEDHFDPGIYAIAKEQFTVEIIDMDFDGYQDIDIFTGFGGNWKQNHIYIMWNPDTESFVGDAYGLAALGLPKFDADNKLVYSMDRASAADHWYYTHQYIEGELVTIEEVSDNCVWKNWLHDSTKEQIKALEPLYEESSTFMHFTKKQLDESTMKLVVAEEKYVLFTGNVEVAEYAPGSEMGLLLRSCERYID